MILPEMNGIISALGGADLKGLILALFTVTALISRPFSGRLADRIGRVPVMIAGLLVCVICSLIYPLVTTIAGLLFLRLVHGFSTGFTPTGQSAYISDIIPATRRGEAMGIIGTAGAIGMAGGPPLGGWIASAYSLESMFYCSAALALTSILLLIRLKETLPIRNKFTSEAFKLRRADLFEPRVIVPCIIMMLCAFAYGALFTVMPDYALGIGFTNKGALFMYVTIASLLIRLLGGKASDRWGRIPVLKVSTFFIAVSMGGLYLADSKALVIIFIFLYGLAQGATSPTLLAWATDLSNPEFKGRGIASLYMAMEFGIGIGALVTGYLMNIMGINVTFLAPMLLGILSFLYLLRIKL